MKFFIVNLFLMIFLVPLLDFFKINSVKLTNDNGNINKFIECKVCQFSFSFNFNYDKLLEDYSTINNIKKYFVNSIDNDELESIFRKDNIENISKEVSMQFFFKGSENQFLGQDLIDYTDCKENKKERDFCDDLKLRLCDEILGTQQMCPNIKKFLDKTNHSITEIKNLQNRETNKINKKSFLQSNILTNTLPQNSHFLDILNNLKELNFKQKPYEEKEDASNNLMKNFLNKNNKLNNNIKNDDFPNNNINFLQLTPNYIDRNLSSEPKSHWTPPKPVLLQSFENSITDQLKDIGFLTTYL